MMDMPITPAPIAVSVAALGRSDATWLPRMLCMMKQGRRRFRKSFAMPESTELSMVFVLRKHTPNMSMRNTGAVAERTAMMWSGIICMGFRLLSH